MYSMDFWLVSSIRRLRWPLLYLYKHKVEAEWTGGEEPKSDARQSSRLLCLLMSATKWKLMYVILHCSYKMTNNK